MAVAGIHLHPFQRDLILFLGSLAVLWLSIVLAVTYGAGQGGLALAPWAAGLLLLGVLAFAGALWWSYHVYADEREPARGEFTYEGRRLRWGSGSYRQAALKAGALEEANAHLEDACAAPTLRREVFLAAVGIAVVASVALVAVQGASATAWALGIVVVGALLVTAAVFWRDVCG